MAAKTPELDENGFRKFGMLDKLAYGAGDFGCNMSFALKGTLTVFWTQYMGIDSYVMAFLLLLVQIWDAINDPLIGAMVDADKHKYKRNKFLQYVWVGSIGLLFAGALCYIPWRGAPAMAKNVLFIAGYVIWDAFYTIANVPYGSMLSLISSDPVDRAGLSTFRSVGAMIGGMSAMILLPFFIYDSENNLLGDRIFIIALVMGILGFISFQFMLKNTIIRVDTEITLSEDTPKFNPLVAMMNFMRNRAAVGATIAPVGMFIGMYGATTAATVLFQAYFKNAQISGLVSMASYLGLFIFIPFVSKIVTRFGKKESITMGSIVTLFGYALLVLLPITPDGKGLALYVVCMLIAAVGGGVGQCIAWSLMADAMDYEEWKFGSRNEGTTYAMHSFFRKLAQGIGPSLGLTVATMMGYNATLGANQPMEVATTMRYVVAGMYILSGVLQLVGYGLVYNLDKNTLEKMQSDLSARRAAKS